MISGHPKGLYLLFFTEMAERFSYYGMRALFVLYLVAAFFNGSVASEIYGSFTGLVYLAPLIGGYVSDRYWGNRRSIIVGGVLMAIGQFLMFASACVVKQSIFTEGGPIDGSIDNSMSLSLLVAGMVFLIVGNGFFKPNISTMVGGLYRQNDSRQDAAFTIFYMGINVGALISPLLCGAFGTGDWTAPSAFKWGFFCAGCGMLASLLVFCLFKSKYLVSPEGVQLGLRPEEDIERKLRNLQEVEDEAERQGRELQQEELQLKKSNHTLFSWRTLLHCLCFIGLIVLFAHGFTNLNDVISAVIYASSIVLPVYIITDPNLTLTDKLRIGVIYIIAVFVIFFWSSFEQAGSSLTLFADKQCDRHIGNWEMPTAWFQSVNPICVVVFAPLVASLWEVMARHSKEPSSPAKQALGLLLLGIGYFMISFVTEGLDVTTKVSMWWLVALYFIMTLGELSLSPIGLSMVTKLSPANLASLLMGVWLMSNAASNIAAGSLATFLPQENVAPKSFLGFEIATLSDFFLLFAVMATVASIILFILTPYIRKMSRGVL